MNDVIVITGSSRGIGNAVAIACASAGAQVVLNGRHRRRLAQAVSDASAVGEVVGVEADISTAAGAEKLLAQSLRAFGKVDVLINNAAWAGPKAGKAWDLRLGDWERALAANLTAPFLCARTFLRWMIANNRQGRILNVDSMAGARAYPGLAAYGVSKSALRALTAHLAADAEGTGITVVGLELDQHRTAMTRSRLPREDHDNLAPPEAAVPLFLHAIKGPTELLAGRTISERRFRADVDAEAALNSPLAACPPFTPYMPRYRRPIGRSDAHVDFLENVLGAPSPVRVMKLGDVARYPDPAYSRLRGTLSARLDLPPESFTFGNGSSELVQRILTCYAGVGDQVISTDPTWPIFERFCAARGVVNLQIEHGGNGTIDLRQVLRAVNSRTRMIYLVNPSNPLGCGIDRHKFIGFLDALPPHLPVVVDEAYVEFSERPRMLRVSEIVGRTKHPLIGVRTFSKFYGLAGLRIGYAFAPPDVAKLLARLELPFAVSSAAERAAIAALEDEEHAASTLRVNREGAKQLRDGLSLLGLSTLPSDANFLMSRTPAEPDVVFEAMTASGLHIPHVGWNRHIQLPIVKPREIGRILDVLARLTDRRSK